MVGFAHKGLATDLTHSQAANHSASCILCASFSHQPPTRLKTAFGSMTLGVTRKVTLNSVSVAPNPAYAE